MKKPVNPDEQQEAILLLIDEVLLPSLSLLDANGCLAIELWSLIKLFPYDIRYGLYGQWQEDTYRKTPQLIFVKHDVMEKTRAILRYDPHRTTFTDDVFFTIDASPRTT